MLPLYAVAAYLFLYLPLAVLGVFSFNSSNLSVWQGFTFHWYREAFHNRRMLDGISTALSSHLASLVSTLAGTLAAYAIWKPRAAGLTNSLYLSFPDSRNRHRHLPARLLSVDLPLSPRAFGLHTVILAHMSFSLAYAVIVVLARLRNFDPTLEEAALDLGATEWQAFLRRHCAIPVPGILAAALLCFAVSFDDYVITSLVAGVNSETLPMVIYALARHGVSPAVNALSALITIGLGHSYPVSGAPREGLRSMRRAHLSHRHPWSDRRLSRLPRPQCL